LSQGRLHVLGDGKNSIKNYNGNPTPKEEGGKKEGSVGVVLCELGSEKRQMLPNVEKTRL